MTDVHPTGAGGNRNDRQQDLDAGQIDQEAQSEDEDFSLAVRESLWTKLEEDAFDARIAENLKMNREVDMWLDAVSKVPDNEKKLVKKEQASLDAHASSSRTTV
jgi:vancomycin resistance protein YoaR